MYLHLWHMTDTLVRIVGVALFEVRLHNSCVNSIYSYFYLQHRRGRGPISDHQADSQLGKLAGFIKNVTCQRAGRTNARETGAWEISKPKPAGVKLVEFVNENCGAGEVFGCPSCTLPPCAPGNTWALEAMFEVRHFETGSCVVGRCPKRRILVDCRGSQFD